MTCTPVTEMTFNVNRVIKNQDLLGCERPPEKESKRKDGRRGVVVIVGAMKERGQIL